MSSIKASTTRLTRPPRKRTGREPGNIQPFVIVLVLSILVIAGGSYWYYRTMRARKMAEEVSETGIRLSDSTRKALRRLKSPVEIRFYALLGADGSPDALKAFSGRVDRLLSGYEREAGGRIIVTSYTSRPDGDLDAAAADGMKAFNLDKGEAWYLGLSVAQRDRKEALALITPEWEQALEADLTRAILRVSGVRPFTEPTAAATEAAKDADAEVKRAIPDINSVPVEKGRQILRERALKKLKTATTEMQTQIQKAQQRLSAAQQAKSEAGQEAAMKQLRRAQAAQAELIQEISARLDDQISAFERLKTVSPGSP